MVTLGERIVGRIFFSFFTIIFSSIVWHYCPRRPMKQRSLLSPAGCFAPRLIVLKCKSGLVFFSSQELPATRGMDAAACKALRALGPTCLLALSPAIPGLFPFPVQITFSLLFILVAALFSTLSPSPAPPPTSNLAR